MKIGNIKEIIKLKKKIPKIIHQIWIGPNLGPFTWINTWRFDYIKANPDWQYVLWTDDNIKTLKYLDFNRYEQERTWNGKSDFLRFAILKQYGGVYIDADSVSIKNKSLNVLIEQAEQKGGFFAAWEDHCKTQDKTIAGGVCGSYPNHIVVNKIIKIQNERWDKYKDSLQAWQTVGPLAVQLGVEDSLETDYIIFPSKYFYPEWWHHYNSHFTKIDTENFPDSFMYQFGYSTNSYVKGNVSLAESDRNNLNDVDRNPKKIKESSKDYILIDRTNKTENLQKLLWEYVNGKQNILNNGDVYIFHKNFSQEYLKNKGISFLIRAKNEEENVKICLDSLVPFLNDLVEIIFVDNNSTDKTLEIAQSYSEKHDNIKTYQYQQSIAKTGINYKKEVQNKPETSISKFYNWCINKTSNNIIIKWDCDFIANSDNLTEMIEKTRLLQRNDNIGLWFTGETLFEHREKYYLKVNSYYDEVRCFNKNYSRWVDQDKCEHLHIGGKKQLIRFSLPVFYELKRTSKDEFSSRGDIIDRRDTEDKDIIDMLNKGKQDSSLIKEFSF